MNGDGFRYNDGHVEFALGARAKREFRAASPALIFLTPVRH